MAKNSKTTAVASTMMASLWSANDQCGIWMLNVIRIKTSITPRGVQSDPAGGRTCQLNRGFFHALVQGRGHFLDREGLG